MKTKIVLLIAFNLLAAQSVTALTPPFTPDMLNDESNVIVEGTLTQVECTGKKIENKCAKLVGRKATLQVDKVKKGFPAKTLYLNYLELVETKNGCIYEPDDLGHQPGEKAKYFLQCEGDKCHTVHWNGTEFIKKSTTPAPECR